MAEEGRAEKAMLKTRRWCCQLRQAAACPRAERRNVTPMPRSSHERRYTSVYAAPPRPTEKYQTNVAMSALIPRFESLNPDIPLHHHLHPPTTFPIPDPFLNQPLLFIKREINVL